MDTLEDIKEKVRTERILEEIMVQDCPNFMKTMPTNPRHSSLIKHKKLYQENYISCVTS